MSEPGDRSPSIRTRLVHPPVADPRAVPLNAPIFQSSTFELKDAAAAASFAEASQPSSFYTRWGNPTVEVWEKVVADLEGGERGLAFSSGMAAVSTTLLALLERGDHVVASNCLYTATAEFLGGMLTRAGVSVDFVDATEAENFDRATGEKTRLFFTESPANPRLSLTDIAAVAETGRQRGIITVVDNTFASPVNQRPLELGADVVVHSATKYLCGHSDVVGGVVVADRERAERIWGLQKVLGGCVDPHAAWLLLRGVKTLAIRVERQNENALKIARALEEHAAVERVWYPGLESHPQHALAGRQMSGFGGMVSFELIGGREAGTRLVESTRWMILAVSLGGVESLIEHPASMSHAALSEEALERAGISPGLVRLSVGIEDADDLLADLLSALASIVG